MPGSSRLSRLKQSCHFPATWSRNASVAIEAEAGSYAEFEKTPSARRRRREQSEVEATVKSGVEICLAPIMLSTESEPLQVSVITDLRRALGSRLGLP